MGYLPPCPEGMIATVDPWVVIEEQRKGYIRYRALDNGRRWEVHGTCAWTDPDRHGPCMEGANVDPIGPPEGRLDCPITPELDCSLCVDEGHLTFTELPSMQELGETLPFDEYWPTLNPELQRRAGVLP